MTVKRFCDVCKGEMKRDIKMYPHRFKTDIHLIEVKVEGIADICRDCLKKIVAEGKEPKG